MRDDSQLDGLLDDKAFGAFFRKSAKAGKRLREKEYDGPVTVIGSRTYIRQSDFEDWLASRELTEPERSPRQLKKLLLEKIAADILRRMERRAG